MTDRTAPRTKAGRALIVNLQQYVHYGGIPDVLTMVENTVLAIEAEAAAHPPATAYVGCPYCGGQYSDMDGHVAHDHPSQPRLAGGRAHPPATVPDEGETPEFRRGYAAALVDDIAAATVPDEGRPGDPYEWLHTNGFSWDDVNAAAAILEEGGYEITKAQEP